MRKLILLIAFLFFLLFPLIVSAEEKIEVPEEVKEISEELGAEYNICPELIQAICCKESRFQADAVNGECVGIMQVSPKWHKDRMKKLGATDLTDMRQNMTVAVDYLVSLIPDGEDAVEALMKYHGESNITQRLQRGQMSSYAESVLEISAKLEREHGK